MPQSAIPCSVHALDHLVLTVASIPRTVGFYTRALGMQSQQFTTPDGAKRWALRFGHTKINLHQRGHEFDPKAAHPTPGSADLCFLTDAPINQWTRHLTDLGIAGEDGPVRRTRAAGPLMSIYLRDPDQNLIEVSVQQG